MDRIEKIEQFLEHLDSEEVNEQTALTNICMFLCEWDREDTLISSTDYKWHAKSLVWKDVFSFIGMGAYESAIIKLTTLYGYGYSIRTKMEYYDYSASCWDFMTGKGPNEHDLWPSIALMKCILKVKLEELKDQQNR